MAFWLCDPKICYISRMNRWIELIFYMPKQISYFDKYWVRVVQNGHCLLGHGTLKYAVSQKWMDELSLFLHPSSDVMIFG